MQNEYCITIFCGFLSVAYRKKAKIVVEPISLSVKPPFFFVSFCRKLFLHVASNFHLHAALQKKKIRFKKNISIK